MDIIWIHGFGESPIIWPDFIKKIKGDYNHFLYDFSKQSGHTTISDYVQVLHAYIQENNIENPIIIGHSMGGYIAIEYARQFGKDLQGIGLFHSSAKSDTDLKKKERLKTISFIEKHGAEIFVKNYYKNLFSEANQIRFKDLIEKNTKELLFLESDALISAIRSMMNRNDNYETLQSLDIPVFQILGKLDPFVLVEDGLEQSILINKPYTLVLDNISHAGMYEASDLCAQFINYFLSEF